MNISPMRSLLYLLTAVIAVPVCAEVRPLSTDRPDSTESPYTVPAGMVQIETELATSGRDSGTRSRSFAEFNFKYGLNDFMDLQLVVPTYQRSKTAGETTEGFGDITIRHKTNFFGNDGGPVAFGMMPFITLPSGADGISAGAVEGGIILPVSLELPAPFGLGIMTELDAVHDDETSDHSLTWINSVVLGVDVTDNLAAFFEFLSVSPFASDSNWEGYFNTGITWQPVADRWQLDGGVRLGMNEAAEDLVLFVGCSTRF